MDDNAPKENPPAGFNKLDLSQLQGFSFGTQWTQDKSAPSERDAGGERPRREDRRDFPGGGPDRRDRRTFRRPAGEGPAGAPPAGGGAPERREFSGDRPPRREGGGEYRGGPRRDGPGGGAPRYDRGGRGGPQERGPYESPYYSVTFYPEDTSFNTLVQTIRKSCRTVELFEIARTVVAKTDRFVVVVAHKAPAATGGAAQPAAEGGPAATGDAAAKRPLLYISVPDGMPFESDEAAVAHVLSNHLDKFFDTSDVEVEPPKGNFLVINKCGVTGELLGPPNFHRYSQIIQQHHATKLPRMAFEAFRSRIETIRDPEIVNQWLAKMKKATRYTWKSSKPVEPSAQKAAAPATEAPSEPAAEAPAVETAPVAPAESAPTPVVTPTFDTLEDARMYLLTQAREKVVRATENARVHGKVAELTPPGEIRRAIEGALERQRKFPLDTANALRGRLRREHFTIFKKGSKGVSYVCAVKRKFRVPGQTFSDSIGAVIAFIETNPMIRASELQTRFLGLAPITVPKPPETAPTVPTEGAEKSETPAPEAAAKPEPTLSIEERGKIVRMQGDLMWLVREGYVTEFIDGRLFAPPPMVEARKKEVEAEEHDPENFPEIPATPATAETPAAPAITETPSAPATTETSAAPEAGGASPPVELAETAPATDERPADEAAPPTDDSKPAS